MNISIKSMGCNSPATLKMCYPSIKDVVCCTYRHSVSVGGFDAQEEIP